MMIRHKRKIKSNVTNECVLLVATGVDTMIKLARKICDVILLCH